MPADAADTAADKMILMGRIGAAHGLKGEVRILSFTEDPEALAAYSPLSTHKPAQTISIKKVRTSKNMLVAVLDGVTDRNAAEALNGTELFVPRDRIATGTDEDEFLQADLIGLPTFLTNGTAHGKILAVANYGADDVLEVRTSSGGIEVLPFTRAVVPEVDITNGRVIVVPPDEVIVEGGE